MLVTSNALYTGIRAEIHIINRCITPVTNSFVVEKMTADYSSSFSTDKQSLKAVPRWRGQGVDLAAFSLFYRQAIPMGFIPPGPLSLVPCPSSLVTSSAILPLPAGLVLSIPVYSSYYTRSNHWPIYLPLLPSVCQW
jgi:hypothetical protein